MLKKIFVYLGCLLSMSMIFQQSAVASPSIGSLQQNQSAVFMTPEGTQYEGGAYAGTANADEYKIQNPDGTLSDTPLSKAIEASVSTVSRQRDNGVAILEQIPSVSEILEELVEDPAAFFQENTGKNVENMAQLTYMLDLKDALTDERILADSLDAQLMQAMEAGTLQVQINGGEVLKQADTQQLYILYIEAETGDVSLLTMENYDQETGSYTMTLTGIGVYMVLENLEA